jgi:hypothetical protein
MVVPCQPATGSPARAINLGSLSVRRTPTLVLPHLIRLPHGAWTYSLQLHRRDGRVCPPAGPLAELGRAPCHLPADENVGGDDQRAVSLGNLVHE